MAGFDEGELIKDLQVWWDDQVGGGPNDPFAVPAPITGTIFDVIPVVDSLGAVSGLITVEKHVGFKVSPRIIRRGGYNSFDDMTSDLLPKIQALVAKKAGLTKPEKKAA